jgi:hypothetical protein
MSTTSRNPGELGTAFSENVGPDAVVVFQGDLSFSTANTGPDAGPKDFDLVFQLQRPFKYDPTAGNLIFDVVTGGTHSAISQTLDFVVEPNADFEEIAAFTAGAEVATGQWGGNVILFTFASDLAGDNDRSGVVDAGDYTVWRKGLGTTYTQTDYDAWRANFGKTTGSGSFANRTIPEPSAFVLVLGGLYAFGRLSRRTVVSEQPIRQNLATCRPLVSCRGEPRVLTCRLRLANCVLGNRRAEPSHSLSS